ncbi:MAG: Gfo/Idh/MocA family oxidoreductase [Tetrasphaera sp.]
MTVKVGILGACGWMGKVHTMAYLNLPFLFGTDRGSAQVAWLVDGSAERLEQTARSIPGVRTTNDWHEVIAAPEVDLVDICLPDALHYEVAKAALQAGKHVYCEKPMTEKTSEARELVDLAAAGNLITRVGHGFMRNPVHDLAKEIIDAGEIGEIKMVKASQHVDSFGDPLAPFMWRADGALAPTGIVGDTGSHVFSILDLLVGRVAKLIADNVILTPRRPKVEGFALGGAAEVTGREEMAEVTNTDATNLMCRFENGAMGLIDFSRTATGRKFTQTYEIYGTTGSLLYSYDETNRLHLYTNADRPGRRGYRAIDVGPERANYGAFLPLANFTLGYNETKYIEAAEVIQSVTTGIPAWPTFENGLHITQLIEACFRSSEQARWVDLSEI